MNVPVERAADLMGISPHHLRVKIQNKRFDFASCDKLSKSNKRYAYYINSHGLAEHLGITEKEVLSCQAS